MIIPGFLIGIIKHVRVDISDKTLTAVSYTHLDVYKRQPHQRHIALQDGLLAIAEDETGYVDKDSRVHRLTIFSAVPAIE